ncbi:hypothetical protein LJ739_00610 [Aestuariibacter halophilus]|uniref:Uncharacterized protein n=1 Tax=Fluctibacter halophilus TaxID=226011 RepID=A0ABS8G2I6_9ALTE|nr:hypothetical protein [Aestuariibacter halophilus]MCC2614740.1 hypothetical protein [Aestuariibacter halophilus]
MPFEQLLFIVGSILLMLIGTMQTLAVSSSSHLSGDNIDCQAYLQQVRWPQNRQTTMWRAWVGMHVSHGFGILVVGAIYLPLAWSHFALMASSVWFSVLPVFISCVYLLLANRYWFNWVFWGMFVTAFCFSTAAFSVHAA